MLAYLVIREGTKWSDVFRLIPGRTVTVGRASTNQIVIKDDRCSRYHAEIFLTQGRWTIRDLESRNGTMVGGQAVHGDYLLSPGESFALPTARWPSSTICPWRSKTRRNSTLTGGPERGDGDGAVHGGYQRFGTCWTRSNPRRSPTAAARRGSCAPGTMPRTRRGWARRPPSSAGWPSIWPTRSDVAAVAKVALEGLFEGTQVDAARCCWVPATAGTN